MVIEQTPQQFGHQQSRWTLALLRQTCEWLRVSTAGSLSGLLKRMGIVFKRARDYIHSPDPDYGAKVDYVQTCLAEAQATPEDVAFVYLDEFSFYRQPSVARAYAPRGHHQPYAYRSTRSNTRCRGVGTLDALTGKVVYHQRSKIGVATLSRFYAALREAYPKAQTIYVAQDNWPVHAHPNVLARLAPQTSPFWPRLPDNWSPLPTAKAVHDDLPIQLLFLPTYAPWLNPIEKLWRWVRQDIIHLHRLADDWQTLKQKVLGFMERFANGSEALLKYVGLLSH